MAGDRRKGRHSWAPYLSIQVIQEKWWKSRTKESILDVKWLMGFENNNKSRKVICHQLTWIPKTQGLSLRMVNDYHSRLTPRPTPSVSWLQEAARHFVIKYTSWEMYSEYPSCVSGTLLDAPMKMTRWDSISLVKRQFGADFNRRPFTRLPGTCPWCRRLL